MCTATKAKKIGRLENGTAQTRTLKRALDIAGTVERLAEFLGAPAAQVTSWLSGECQTPAEAYLQALDVVAQGDRFKAKARRGKAARDVGLP